MPPAENGPVDIEILMARIREEVSRRRSSSVIAAASDPSRRYVPGTILRFGIDGNAIPFLGAGWCLPEDNYHWSDGEVSELVLSIDPPPIDLVLSVTARPFLATDLEEQPVTVLWNGVAVSEWTFQKPKTCDALIFAHLLAASPTGRVQFQLPGSASPLLKGVSADPRRLALAFLEVVLRPASEFGFRS